MLNYNPATIWFTGLPSSGKTTLGEILRLQLNNLRVKVVILDGDAVRKNICSDLGFSEEDRAENIRRVASLARLLNDQDFVVVCCFVSPLISMRDMAKSIVGKDRFFDIFVDADLESCRQRDVKGLYAKASQGLIADLTGVTAPYEKPTAPSLAIKSDKLTVKESSEIIYSQVCQWLNLL